MNGDALTLQPELGCNSPEVVEEEYILAIRNKIDNHPRTLQTAIGPSEIGTTCPRNLMHKLAGDPEPPDPDGGWLQAIGTAVHDWLADAFRDIWEGRYLVEHEVSVGKINGIDIKGHLDLFDKFAAYVIDHKIVGLTTLKEVRRHAVENKQVYRVQAHSYGYGLTLKGYHVNRVAIAFLPRNAISLNDRYFWSEPYDERIALAALERCNKLVALMDAVGMADALAMYPSCGGINFCRWCPAEVIQPNIDPNADPFAATTRKKRVTK